MKRAHSLHKTLYPFSATITMIDQRRLLHLARQRGITRSQCARDLLCEGLDHYLPLRDEDYPRIHRSHR